MLRCYFIFLVAVLGYLPSSAQQQDVTIELRDYHTSRITDIVASTLHPYFYTADESGKILAYSTKTKRVIKTIRESSGLPVKNLRLAFDDKVLSVNQKFAFGDGKQDSIISIGIFDQKVLQKLPGSIEFIGNQNDVIIMKDTNADKSLNIINVFDRNFKEINKYYMSGRVTLGAYDSLTKTIALVEGNIGNQLKVVLQVDNDFENRVDIEIPKDVKIQDLFFDNQELFAVTSNKEKEQIEIYNLSKSHKFSSSIFQVKDYSVSSANVNRFKKDDLLTLTITPRIGLSYVPLIIQKTNSKFNAYKPETTNGAVNSTYLNDTGELVFFEQFYENTTNSVKFFVFDTKAKKTTARFPKDEKPFYSGLFLPNNNWLVYGSEINKSNAGFATQEFQLKYYETGTYNNRFGKLDYTNYLEFKHGISDFSNGYFNINKDTGIRAFYGYKQNANLENEYGFYGYDIIKDEVNLLSNKEVAQRTIIDFNSTTKDLLLSIRAYYNGGHTDPQQFVILNGNDLRTIEGLYKFGKFSKNGKYLLLISNINEVTIRQVSDLKAIHTETLKDGKYNIMADDTQGFVVANSYWELSMETCNQSSIGFQINESGEVGTTVLDCVNIIDVASKNDVTVAAIEGMGIVINKAIYKFPYSEFPEKVSLNDDGTKVMLSFTNGKIKIYETEGLKFLAEMQHPSKDSHAFVDANNNYFSNINAADYIVAFIKGKGVVDLEVVESDYFNPTKVLEAFGTPNKEYVALLNKALELKAKNKFESVDIDTAIKPMPTDSKIKGDLYFLTVGVSDYEQTDYNLTFADKDALDMAKIYGQLSAEDLEAYKEKFYGNSFTLKSDEDSFLGTMNRYDGVYSSLRDFIPIATDGTIWLVKNGEDVFTWNYNTKTIQPFQFPSGIELQSYSFDTQIVINPDNSGFYIKSTDNEFYEYTFSSQKFEKVKMPKMLSDQTVYYDDLIMLNNHSWAYFDNHFNGNNNEIVIAKGKVNAEDADYLRFNPTIFKLNYNEENPKLDSLDFYSAKLKALSSNGEHLLYSDMNGGLFYKNLSLKNDYPLKLNIREITNYKDVISISNDGSSFSVTQSGSDEFYYKVEKYDLTGRLLHTQTLGDDVVGFVNYDNNPVWITSEAPLVEQNYFGGDELLEKAKATSFNSVITKHLVNEEATSESIKDAILNVFENAKPEDQIVLFLAGHGVLDKELNYYYAPHDMDFNDVERNGINFKTLLGNLNQSQSNNKLLLMDTCHSGNTLDIEADAATAHNNPNKEGERGSKSRSTNDKPKFKLSDVISDVFEDFLSKSGVTVISASSGEDVAYENKTLGNGAFTSAYINMLKTELKDGGFVLAEENLKKPIALTDRIISDLLKQVMLLTDGKQTPDLRELNKDTTIKLW